MRDDSSEALIERLVTECLERIPAEGDSVVARICDEHPDVASEVRASLETLRATGFEVDQPAPASTDRLGAYRLLSPLGAGAMGVVHHAVNDDTGADVALKIIRPEYRFFAGAQERFRLEMEAAARLDHPGIVPLREVGEADGVPYLAMERVDGRTLAELLQMAADRSVASLAGRDMLRMLGAESESDAEVPVLFRGSWTDTCLRIARDVARALQHAHDCSVLHRDVKPSNIMVTAEGRVLLMDFGLARAEGRSRVTRTGAMLGSHAYMSPEQMRAAGPADGRTDVYALGVSLYEMLTLRLPYESSDTEALRQLIVAGQPESMKHALRTIPLDVETVCFAAMDTDPRRRYATPAAFADDLENLLGHRAVRARRPGAWLTTRRHAARHPVVALAIGFAAVLIVGAVAFGIEQHALRQEAAQSSERFRRLSRSVVALADLQALSADAGTLSTLGELCDELLASPEGDPPQRLAVLSVTGDVYRLHGNYQRALELLGEAVALGRSLGSGGALALSDSLTKLGRLHLDQGDPETARTVLLEALEIRRAQLGDLHGDTAEVLSEIGVAESMLFEHESGRDRLLAAIAIYSGLPGNSSSEVAATLNTLARLEMKQGRADEAAAALEQAGSLERAALRSTDLVTLQTRDLRAQLVMRLERDDRTAETLYRENLAIRRALYGNRPLEIADNLSALALTLRSLGDYAASARLHRESLDIRRELTPDDIHLQAHLYAAASVHRLLGDFDGSRALYEEARQSLLLHHELGDNFLAKIDSALADVAFESGHLEEAVRRYEDVYAKMTALDRPLDIQAAWTDVNRALVLRRLGRNAEADDALQRAVPVYEGLVAARREKQHSGFSKLVNTLEMCGQVHALAGNEDRAEALIRESIALREETGPRDPRVTANVDGILGQVLVTAGRLEEAEPLLLRSYESLRIERGVEHLDTARAIERLVTLYEAWSRTADADTWSERLPAVFRSPLFRSPYTI